MRIKTPVIVFFIAASGIPFISSIHAISEDRTALPILDPGFPSVGEYSLSDLSVPSETLTPLAVFEEVGTSTIHSVIPTTTPSFNLREVSVELPPKSTAPSQPLPHSDRLVIPSIGLDVAIGSVGLTPTGNMDVLDNPKKVSWYKDGAVPGEQGSAVIGAHVYQSFAELESVRLGDVIYVERADGVKSRFIVSEIQKYPYTATEPLPKIFNRRDKARLNLITCDGDLTADGSTYTHRLVVFAELAN